MSFLGRFFDERFFAYRLRSTSIAGIAGAWMAGGLFLWHLYREGVPRWDLAAVLGTMVIVKFAVMAWSYARR